MAKVDRIFFRSIALRHFLPPHAPAPLYVSAAGLLGTRFIAPKSSAGGLYVAWDAETAHREGNQTFYADFDATGIDPAVLDPPTEVALIGIRIRASLLLDLRPDHIRASLDTNLLELAAPWKAVDDAPTQRLGQAVYDDGGFEGLIYPSAQHAGGICLMVFPDRLINDSLISYRSATPGVPDARLGPTVMVQGPII